MCNSAIFVANISAQEMKQEKCKGFNPAQKVEFEIKRLAAQQSVGWKTFSSIPDFQRACLLQYQ